MDGPRESLNSGDDPFALRAHAAALLLLVPLTLLFTWPLPVHLREAVLGAGAGDNMSAIWNIWWAGVAIRGPDALLWTHALFAPLGTSLVLHSFAPLESVAAAVLWPGDPVTAYNLTLAALVFLNGACAYWAAWTVTRDSVASFFAAVAFAGAPFLLLRLHGHLNVLSAWALPLVLVAVRHYRQHPGWLSSLWLAPAIAVLAYSDAYYVIFGVTLIAAYLVLSEWPVVLRRRPLTTARRRTLTGLIGLSLVLIAVIVWIETTGGTDTTLLGARLRMTDSFNPRVILGFLLIAALVAWAWPALALEPGSERTSPVGWRPLTLAAVVAFALASPLVTAGFELWRAGDYESQTYFWRSAPPGIDLASLVLGNPLGFGTGRQTTSLLQQLSIDWTESAAWLGAAPLLLFALALARLRSNREARVYFWITALFFVWSLGPYLRVFGFNTGFMLPQTLLRFIPVVSNARIPGRAFVVVVLMVAMLGAMTIAHLRRTHGSRTTVAVALAALVLDFWPAHPSIPVERPAIYDTLASEPPGVVLEIPLGLRDGFGERGALNHHALVFQTVHGHPQMGGFVARLSSRVESAYEHDPIVGPILALSEGKPAAEAPSAEPPAQCDLTCGVRYVVIDDAAASTELQAFVARSFRLRLRQRSGSRALYEVDR